MKLADFKSRLQASGEVKFNSQCNFEQLWCFTMSAKPEGIWTYLSDSSRFNRAVGLAPREQKEVDGKMIVTTSVLGMTQIWVEEPWNWINSKLISFERNYIKGMAKYVHSVFLIERDETQNKSLVYIYFGWQLPNPIFKFFVQATESIIKSKFQKNFTQIDEYLKKHSQDFSGRALTKKPAPLQESQQNQLKAVREKLLALNLKNEVLEKLIEHITTGDDMELDLLRVLQLARDWNFDYRDLLATSLHATRHGLLNLSWNVVCPHCRGARVSAASLGDIPPTAECDTCDVDFSSSEADVIEVVFKINPSVRVIPDVLYCAAEPAKKSHIKVQQKIAAQEGLNLQGPIKEGIYRARVQGQEQSYRIEVLKDLPAQKIVMDFNFKNHELQISTGFNSELQIKNTSLDAMNFTLEEMQWSTLALRPAHVLAFPEFRDLFSEEHLQSTVNLNLGQQTLMFTDIVGSTKFYEQVGDAKAFKEVSAHFQEVFTEVKKHNGVVVKTIGDAVMAAFPSTQDGFAAALDIQKRFYQTRPDSSIRVRISLHTGNVIAVQLGAGIDYFGSVVNLGAKIQACADAGEIALTSEVFNRIKKEVQDLPYPITEKTHTRDAAQAVPVSVVFVK